MITVDLKGGLGNQMFQIFTLISCSIEQKNPFYINRNKFAGEIINTNENNDTIRHTYWESFFKHLRFFLKNEDLNLIQFNETNFHYSEMPIFPKNKNILLFGYFQSYKYFEKNLSSILKYLKFTTLKDEIIAKTVYNYDNSISLHFRMGDYVKVQEHHPILKIDYYISSLKHVITLTNKNDWNIIYYCEKNDYEEIVQKINILKDHFKNLTFICIDFNLKDYEQMITMSLCKHNIIANSSFSWWGAYLNDKEDKIVTYPNTWFGPAQGNKKMSDLFPENWYKIYEHMNNSPLTCVSGYWKIKNKHGDQFNNWLDKTLKINCPYVFFADKETIEMIKKYRGKLPTHYIECNIEDFYTYQYYNKMVTHELHSPSIELNLIWNEKIFLIQKAAKLNPFHSSHFIWVDAGICNYRDNPPPKKIFPNLDKLDRLPKDKFIFTSRPNYDPNDSRYYYKMSYITGTYLLHNSIIDKFVGIYKEYLDKLVDKSITWTDQVILTHIYNDNEQLFYKLSDGWGKIIPLLY